jgi:hypothetical protein
MSKQLQLFLLKNMHLVQGLADDFDGQIQTMVRDCKERPGMKRPREITIRVRLTPHENGEDVLLEVTTGNKLPTKMAEKYRMMTTTNHGLKFNPDNPETPQQSDFLEE